MTAGLRTKKGAVTIESVGRGHHFLFPDLTTVGYFKADSFARSNLLRKNP